MGQKGEIPPGSKILDSQEEKIVQSEETMKQSAATDGGNTRGPVRVLLSLQGPVDPPLIWKQKVPPMLEAKDPAMWRDMDRDIMRAARRMAYMESGRSSGKRPFNQEYITIKSVPKSSIIRHCYVYPQKDADNEDILLYDGGARDYEFIKTEKRFKPDKFKFFSERQQSGSKTPPEFLTEINNAMEKLGGGGGGGTMKASAGSSQL